MNISIYLNKPSDSISGGMYLLSLVLWTQKNISKSAVLRECSYDPGPVCRAASFSVDRSRRACVVPKAAASLWSCETFSFIDTKKRLQWSRNHLWSRSSWITLLQSQFSLVRFLKFFIKHRKLKSAPSSTGALPSGCLATVLFSDMLMNLV